MGKIRIGKDGKKSYESMGPIVPTANLVEKKQEDVERRYSEEDKERIRKEVMSLPREQIVPELRRRGLNDLAELVEKGMKEQEAFAAEIARKAKEKEDAKRKEESRAQRLEEIKAMPEEEQLPLLLAEGYEDEARELSEKLAEQQNQGDGGESTGTGEQQGDGEQHEETETSEQESEGKEEAPADAAPAGEAPAGEAPADGGEDKTKKTRSSKLGLKGKNNKK